MAAVPPAKGGWADRSHVPVVAGTIGANSDGHKVIVNNSTVSVGAADLAAERIAAEQAKRGINAASTSARPGIPQRWERHRGLRQAGADIRGYSNRVHKLLRDYFAPLHRNHDKLILFDVRFP